MIEIVCEFVVKEEARGQFELAYGPGGAWSKLFAPSPGFRGATLLRDEKNPRRYLTIDLGDTEVQREQARAERQAEYADLDAAFAGWTESRTKIAPSECWPRRRCASVADHVGAKREWAVEGAAEQDDTICETIPFLANEADRLLVQLE